MDLKALFSTKLSEVLKGSLTTKEIYSLIETPKNDEHGDLAFPCFQLAKIQKISPIEIAKQLASQINDLVFSKIDAVGPYVNIFFSKKS